jgi:hypothetical protein
MTRFRQLSFSAAAAMLSLAGAEKAVVRRAPIQVGSGYLASQGATPRFSQTNQLSDEGKSAVMQDRIVSVPHWSGSFTFKGTVFPYIMAGGNPRNGDTTQIGTDLIAISLVFDEFADASGNPVVIDVTPVLPNFLDSPNFVRSSYSSGFAQFGDAVQRAEFFNVAPNDWHTELNRPRRLTPVTIEVPVGASFVFHGPNGLTFALVDANFFFSQLNTIVQLEDIHVDEFSIALARNTLLFDNGDPKNCCTLGFHTAFETKAVGNKHFVQTFGYAAWLDPGIFNIPGIADVDSISHEISEFLNDPFVNNIVPRWKDPGGGGCQDFLETGDPVENLAHPAFPVMLHGFLYHPQVEALLQWFSRESPSSAIQGAYSYPDTSTLPGPSQACPPG